MSNLIAHAKRELAILRGPSPEPDEMQDAIEAHVLAMVKMFADEGHSGSSAAYTLDILKKVLAFEPITPLTGADDEWVSVDGPSEGDPERACFYQNNRCSRVFKDANGAYDSQGRVFRDPDGTYWTNSESRTPVTFPYTPTTEIVDRAVN